MLLLCRSNAFFGETKSVVAAGFHLTKNQVLSIFGDDINFTLPCPPIIMKNIHTSQFEKLKCGGFSPLAKQIVFGHTANLHKMKP